MTLRFYFLLFLLNLSIASAQTGQRPALERMVSVQLSNEPVKNALDQIADQGKVTFSYPSALINTTRKITLTARNKTIREVLFLIFGSKVSWKAKGNYIILSIASAQRETAKSPVYIIKGYVVNEKTGEKIPSVSIYEGKSMVSTVTNQYGYFSIRLDDPKVQLQLKVSKQNYQDTLVSVHHRGEQMVEIMIRPSVNEVMKDTFAAATFPDMEFLIPQESAINAQNISDTLYRKGQISFLPILGTNYRLSGNVINDYSLNILGGYSLGTRKAELAGLFNITRGDAKYVQVAGLANATGGTFTGVQVAGYLNMVRHQVNGVQIGGFGNLVWDSLTGVQLAGFFNFNRGYTNGVQVAGFLNTNLDTSRGVQVAGFLNASTAPMSGVMIGGFTNVAVKGAKGVQIAGFANTTIGAMKGAQVAGFGNISTKEHTGAQISGFMNINLKQLTGLQISPFLNYAKNVTGTQIGIINVADSSTGTPIGLISFVRSGYHRVEVSADEIFYTNLSLRTGTNSFHNILFAGIDPTSSDTNLWTFGYGLGTSITAGRSTMIDIDLTSQQVNFGTVGPKINLLTKLHVGIEQKIAKGFHLNTGPVLTAQLTNRSYNKYPEIFNGIQPSTFWNGKLDNSTDIRCWIGWKLGLRFF